jgi:hypothetical protein
VKVEVFIDYSYAIIRIEQYCIFKKTLKKILIFFSQFIVISIKVGIRGATKDYNKELKFFLEDLEHFIIKH